MLFILSLQEPYRVRKCFVKYISLLQQLMCFVQQKAQTENV